MPKPSIPELLTRLRAKYPDARYELDWSTPLELLVATILAAQCTDERVNRVTPALFRKYPNAAAYAYADTAGLEEDIKSTGFYRNKAKAIQGACKGLVDRFGGEVPRSLEQLITLPGIQRKSANVILNTAFDMPTGIIVDTHVARISPRIGLTTKEKPDDIEVDLMKAVPKSDWTFFGPAMVLHGRYTCTARGPHCSECVLEDICAKNLKGEKPAPAAKASDDEEEVKPVLKAKKSAPAKKTTETGGTMPTSAIPAFPSSWRPHLDAERDKPYFKELAKFLEAERKSQQVFPPAEEVFSALELTPYDEVNVLLLGQDPYHDDDQAHGLCFSVKPGIKAPPSLANMYKELKEDVGFKIPNNGYLVPWAKQGMLMLNAVLTVRAHTPNSHKDKGWETFTDAVIRKVNEKSDRVIFVLWGGYAQKKEKLIDGKKHLVLKGAHPSPLSARAGFFGSKPFSTINKALKEMGKAPIDWQLPNL